MSNPRSFTGAGSRSSGSTSMKAITAEIMRLERQKKGRLPANERFKLMMKMRLAAMRANGAAAQVGTKATSKKGQEAMQMMAKKKAAKERRALDEMVIIKAQNFTNGTLTKSGKIYDVAGNMVGTVNKKNGVMATNSGTGFGKYKPKSMGVTNAITAAINAHSPYFINLRKMQNMQAGTDSYNPYADSLDDQSDTLNVYGGGSRSAMLGGGYTPLSERGDHFGSFAGAGHHFDDGGSSGHNSGGVASADVFGAATNNVWGTNTDNVWGTDGSTVWGGVGGNPFGGGSSGGGKDFLGSMIKSLLRPVGNSLARLFGSLTGINLGSGGSSSQARMRPSNSVGAYTPTVARTGPTVRNTPGNRNGN